MDSILEKPDYKTVRISTRNYERITKFGKYQETMDEIITKVLEKVEVKG